MLGIPNHLKASADILVGALNERPSVILNAYGYANRKIRRRIYSLASKGQLKVSDLPHNMIISHYGGFFVV